MAIKTYAVVAMAKTRWPAVISGVAQKAMAERKTPRKMTSLITP